jgi:hypothetical protein
MHAHRPRVQLRAKRVLRNATGCASAQNKTETHALMELRWWENVIKLRSQQSADVPERLPGAVSIYSLPFCSRFPQKQNAVVGAVYILQGL